MKAARPGLWRAYRMPALLAVTSLVGLASALLEDGLYDLLSWLLLGGLLAAMRPRRPRRPEGMAGPHQALSGGRGHQRMEGPLAAQPRGRASDRARVRNPP